MYIHANNGDRQLAAYVPGRETSAPVGSPVWYAIHTRAKHERKVAIELAAAGVEFFLPLVKQIHRWSDRNKTLELPLFPCYLFARTVSSSSFRLMLFKTGSVLGLLGNHGYGTPIPDEELENVRRVVGTAVPVGAHPFLKIGQRVVVRGGALDGVQGILVGRNGGRRLVVSLDAIQRSIAIALVGYEVEPA